MPKKHCTSVTNLINGMFSSVSINRQICFHDSQSTAVMMQGQPFMCSYYVDILKGCIKHTKMLTSPGLGCVDYRRQRNTFSLLQKVEKVYGVHCFNLNSIMFLYKCSAVDNNNLLYSFSRRGYCTILCGTSGVHHFTKCCSMEYLLGLPSK